MSEVPYEWSAKEGWDSASEVIDQALLAVEQELGGGGFTPDLEAVILARILRVKGFTPPALAGIAAVAMIRLRQAQRGRFGGE